MTTILDLPADILCALTPYLGRGDLINFEGAMRKQADDEPEDMFTIVSLTDLTRKYKNWSRLNSLDISAITKVETKQEEVLLHWLFTHSDVKALAINAELVKYLFTIVEPSDEDVLYKVQFKPTVQQQRLWSNLTYLKVKGVIGDTQTKKLLTLCSNVTHVALDHDDVTLAPQVKKFTCSLTCSSGGLSLNSPFVTDLTINLMTYVRKHPTRAFEYNNASLSLDCPSLERLTINDRRVNPDNTSMRHFKLPKLKYIAFGVNKDGKHPPAMLQLYEDYFSDIYLQPTPAVVNRNRGVAMGNYFGVVKGFVEECAKHPIESYDSPPQKTHSLHR